eukprot:m.17278 g.17278  ORF g.17278 m.17278 type:complete len:472 (-) comp3478_c0_seq1:245-1660(-)
MSARNPQASNPRAKPPRKAATAAMGAGARGSRALTTRKSSSGDRDGKGKRWLGDTRNIPRRAHPFLSPPEEVTSQSKRAGARAVSKAPTSRTNRPSRTHQPLKSDAGPKTVRRKKDDTAVLARRAKSAGAAGRLESPATDGTTGTSGRLSTRAVSSNVVVSLDVSGEKFSTTSEAADAAMDDDSESIQVEQTEGDPTEEEGGPASTLPSDAEAVRAPDEQHEAAVVHDSEDDIKWSEAPGTEVIFNLPVQAGPSPASIAIADTEVEDCGDVPPASLGSDADVSPVHTIDPPVCKRLRKLASQPSALGGRPLSIVIETPSELNSPVKGHSNGTDQPKTKTSSPLSKVMGSRDIAVENGSTSNDFTPRDARRLLRLADKETEDVCRLQEQLALAACLLETEPAQPDYQPSDKDDAADAGRSIAVAPATAGPSIDSQEVSVSVLELVDGSVSGGSSFVDAGYAARMRRAGAFSP